MDNASLPVVECNMSCVCENVSMSVYPHACDDTLHDSLGGVKIVNVKLLKKKALKFEEKFSNILCENDGLIAKLNESNKFVEMYKRIVEYSLKNLKEFECLDLDAKLVLFNKLVDDLKYENESLKMYAKCFIVKPNDKK